MRYRILGTTQALRRRRHPRPGRRRAAARPADRARPAARPDRARPASWSTRCGTATPPADAPAALQALVGRLRRALGPDTIASAEGGYRLCAAPDDVDLHRFERLADEGTRALADGDPAKAAGVLDDALALWHGPALADLPDRTAEAARWETRRLDTRRARLTAALALGAAERSLPELTALCDSHPLDEPLQALRLRALRDAGRPAQALAAYEDVRRLLADRLGADPGPELRSLHAELLNPDEGPERPTRRGARAPRPPAAASRTPRTRLPRGAARPAVRPALGASSGTPARSRPSPPAGNLRARLTSFVGREADIEAIRGDLAARPARHPARARRRRQDPVVAGGRRSRADGAGPHVGHVARDGVWLAELAPVADPDAVPEAVLTAVGARETVLRGAGAEELRAASAERHDDPLVRLTEHCANRRMLILLDNCEHVVDAAAQLVAELLARCPGAHRARHQP